MAHISKRGRKTLTLVLGSLLAVLGGGLGQSAEVPVLTDLLLPSAVRTACPDASFRIHWLAQVKAQALYVVHAADCPGGRRWIIGLRTQGTAVLLAFRHRLWIRPVAGSYPVLLTSHLRRPGALRTRSYRFSGAQYRLVAQQDYYRAAGVACGTASSCAREAGAALRVGDTARAVAIWRRLGVRGIF